MPLSKVGQDLRGDVELRLAWRHHIRSCSHLPDRRERCPGEPRDARRHRTGRLRERSHQFLAEFPSFDQLHVGTQLCIRTDQGRLTYLRIIRMPDPNDFMADELAFQYVVWSN
jgi:hypothetical protein